MDAETIDPPDVNDPEFLAVRWGPEWRVHLVPEPDNLDERNGIADLVPGAETDTPPEARGPASKALAFHIASACSGYARPPTPRELYESFHTEAPTARSEALLRMWMDEASPNDFFDAWHEHCYTWRELAAACRRHGILNAKNARTLNMFARRKAERRLDQR